MTTGKLCLAIVLASALASCSGEDSPVENQPPVTMDPVELANASSSIGLQRTDRGAPAPIIPPATASSHELFALANSLPDGPQDVVFYTQRRESLTLYAKWSKMERKPLATANHLGDTDKELPVNSAVTLTLTASQLDRFEQERRQFHEAYQARFYEKYTVNELKRHEIQRGDTLWALARMHGEPVPLWLLEKANPGRDLSVLQIGQPIKIPVVQKAGAGYSDTSFLPSFVKKNTPAKPIALRPAPTKKPLRKVAPPKPAPVVKAPAPAATGEDLSIKVQRGESLSHYTAWSGLTVEEILVANGLSNPDRLRAGQALRLPLADPDVAGFYSKRKEFLLQLGLDRATAEVESRGEWKTHDVALGENAWVIAVKQHEISLAELQELNPGVDLERLRPGTILRVPTRKAAE